ncbi:MAG: signal recognition particle-docking protein FtsY, partial [Planctomycetes bacterium]|nr:signal recognition particle-docking protein FtsY [Planctomycetota bacterium]
DPAATCYDALEKAAARGYDYLLIDTAGRLQTKEHLMRELEKLTKVIKKRFPNSPHEVLLTLDATTGQNALSQTKEFNSFSKLTGIVLTKLDGTAKGGIILSLAKEFSLPVKLVGTGEQIDDIDTFKTNFFIDSLFNKS